MKQFTLEGKNPAVSFLIIYGFCLFLSILFLLIATKSSPLYPFNDWVDANISFTMGKGMMNGRILYRDVFDHKGPLFYLLYGLAYLISNTSFLGVFIFEVIFFSIFLYFCFKLLSLFLDINYSLIALPLIAVSILNLKSFAQGGSSEEFCLPLIAVSLYYLFNYFKNVYPKPMPNRWILINGIIAGCVLWIKFSLLGFWFGWMASTFICMLINNGFLRAIKGSIVFIIGMLTATLPWIGYFGINHSISEWINSYIIINITSYSKATTLISIIIFTIIGILKHLVQNPVIIGLLYFGLIVFIIVKKFIHNFFNKFSLLFCFLFLALSVFGGGRNYIYYFLTFTPFIIFGFIVLLTLFYEKFGVIKFDKSVIIILIILIIAFCYTVQFNHNTTMLKVNREDLVQYKYASIIKETEDATLLNYGTLDGGFYTTTGIIPNIRFFQNLNISYSKFPLVMDEQNRYIKEQVVDFIVIQVLTSNYNENFEIPYLDDNYTLIEEEIQQNENSDFYYLLFKKK